MGKNILEIKGIERLIVDFNSDGKKTLRFSVIKEVSIIEVANKILQGLEAYGYKTENPDYAEDGFYKITFWLEGGKNA